VFREEYIAIVARELLKGLEYLHSEGKLHRDIKGELSSLCLAFCAEMKHRLTVFGVVMYQLPTSCSVLREMVSFDLFSSSRPSSRDPPELNTSRLLLLLFLSSSVKLADFGVSGQLTATMTKKVS